MRRAVATTAVLVAALVGGGSSPPDLNGEVGQKVLAQAGFAKP
jgi:hypothetical protein